MQIRALMFGLLLLLAACGDSNLQKRQYAEGAAVAREQGCDCDPFRSEAAGGEADSAEPVPLGAHWISGYINACVDLQRVCRAEPQKTGE